VAHRTSCGIPEEAGHIEKWQPALDMIDETRSWDLDVPLVIADGGYGDTDVRDAALVAAIPSQGTPYSPHTGPSWSTTPAVCWSPAPTATTETASWTP
jgi:DDE superfamily endonuclease